MNKNVIGKAIMLCVLLDKRLRPSSFIGNSER